MLILRHKRKTNIAFVAYYQPEEGFRSRVEELPEGGFGTSGYPSGPQMRDTDLPVKK
jgi:hypothetical protein